MATELPLEIQNDTTLYAKNETLKTLRGQLITINSQIISGTYSSKSLVKNIYNQLIDTINFLIKQIEIIIIPEEYRTDFALGNVTLDEYGSFDIIAYYNELQKLKLNYYSLVVAIQQMNEARTVSNNPVQLQTEGILNQLNEEEFLVQGTLNPTYDQEQTYKYYTIIHGDTLPTIASKNYNGDISQWSKIAIVNNITDNDLLDNNLVGHILKIPVISQTNNKVVSNNLIYETQFLGTSQTDIDKYLYGRDIFLLNKKMQISSSNDIKRVSGRNCVVQNIKARFYNLKGSLNPLNIAWGLDSLDFPADIPPVISLDRLLTDMEYQAMADPRVITATVLRNKLSQTGDRLDVEMEIQLIGNSDSIVIPIEVPSTA